MVLFATDSNKNLLVLHSFKNAGGTLVHPEKKLMCLSGTGALAAVFEVIPLTRMAECNLVPPTIDALRKCMTAIEVVEVEAPDENGLVTYPASASFLPAANSSDPFLLTTVANVVATIFDLEHKEDENYITSAADHAGDFILWAWGIGTDQVSATSIIFDPTDTATTTSIDIIPGIGVEFSCIIIPVPAHACAPPPPPLLLVGIVAAAAARQESHLGRPRRPAGVTGVVGAVALCHRPWYWREAYPS